MRREDYPYAAFAFCTLAMIVLLAGVALFGCASVSRETVEVKVPVAVRAAPPVGRT